MEDTNWGKFGKYKSKLKNRCNKIFIRGQKAKSEQKKLKIQTISLM